MSTEQELFEIRLAKAAKAREMGLNPYANDFRVTQRAQEIHDAHGEDSTEALDALDPAPSYRIAGRVMAMRNFGKAAFLQLLDGARGIQVYVRKNNLSESDFAAFKDLVDMGDILGVVGRPMRTRTGELTVEASEVKLLTKALRPLPDKWAGLTDKEARYRQRWVDMTVNPDVMATFRKRSRMITETRKFFEERGFLEVETPMMHPVLGGAAARPFTTHHNALDMPLFMRIAPELYLKRVITGGIERVYEINRNFRNEGLSAQHNPEFTMLEFYWSYANYEDLMELTEQLVVHLVKALHPELPDDALKLSYQGQEIDFTPPWTRLTVREAVQRFAEPPPEVFDDAEAALAFARQVGAPIPEDATTESWPLGKLLLEIFEATGEAKLVNPTFLCDYPIEVSPLSRKKESDPSLVDRFEFFIAGFEVGNGFSELNDPVDQRQRFESQMAARAAGDEEAMELDENYLMALEQGMPPTAGEGIGIDRLAMLLTDQPSIRDVILFPLLRNVPAQTPSDAEGADAPAAD